MIEPGTTPLANGSVEAGFIGRDRELAELLAGLEDAARGRGRISLVVGEPGIGKTELAEQLAMRAEDRGTRVLWGRAWLGGGTPPYWAWAQIVRALALDCDDETLRPWVTGGPGSLAVLVPELAARCDVAPESTASLDSDRGRFALFDSVTRFLRQVSSDQPLVLVLDDVLTGDSASLLLLRFLAREIRTAHILVIATCRDADAAQSPDGIELVADVVREGHVVELRGLERDEVGALVAALTGVLPRTQQAAAIHEATAGNPLFVREVTRLVAAEEALDRPGRLQIRIPPTVRAVIRQRLALLSADAVAALSSAAVVGHDFDLPLVEAASDLPRERVSAAVAEVVALGMVTASLDSSKGYRFAHPLMRDVVYEALPLRAREQMHQQVGAAIERGHGTDARASVADLALHFALAGGDDAGRAVRYGLAAGDQAMEGWAYDEAIAAYRRALEALGKSGQDGATRCELLLRLGAALARAGEYAEAKATFLDAASLARSSGDAERLARAALGYGSQPVGGGLVDRQLAALLQEALDTLPPGDAPLRAQLLARLAVELTFSGEAALTESLSLEALDMGRRLADPATLVHAWRARWMAVWGPAGLEERTGLAEEMLALAHRNGDAEMELIARARRLTCSLEVGDIRAVESDMAVHARLAAELRMPVHEWSAATLRAMRALLHGDLAEAEHLADGARSLQAAESNAASAHIGQLTLVRWEQGRLGELRDVWHALIEQFPSAGFGRGWLCLANAELGRIEEARICLQAAVDEALNLPRNGLWLLALSSTTLAAAKLADTDAAAALYPLLLPYADRTIIVPMPHPISCYGSASLYLGLLASTLSRWDAAERHFEAALEANRRLGAGAFLARTRGEYADMLLRRGRPADGARALELLRQAAAAANALGLTATGEVAAALRARAEARGPDPDASSERAEHITDEASPVARATDVFQREGEFWTVTHAGTTVRLRDSKGMRCLALLLVQPGREILALELETSTHPDARGALPVTVPRETDDDLEPRGDLGDAGELLDAEAKAAYRTRLSELREELDEAESFNDPARASRAREEIEFLTTELARAVGLGGRDRRAASHAERARLNVSRAIHAALRNIARVHPSLGEHLSVAIRTGRYCCYAPDPRAPIQWQTALQSE